MRKLNLHFLDSIDKTVELSPIEKILHEYGQEIYDYAKGYFNYIVTTTSFADDISGASLYIIVPEIGYDYKILELSYKDVENVNVKFFTLKTEQVENDIVNINGNDWSLVRARISQLLSTDLADSTFRFLINQVHLKRNTNEEE